MFNVLRLRSDSLSCLIRGKLVSGIDMYYTTGISIYNNIKQFRIKLNYNVIIRLHDKHVNINITLAETNL